MNVYCSETCVPTDNKYGHVYTLFALYDLVLEML